MVRFSVLVHVCCFRCWRWCADARRLCSSVGERARRSALHPYQPEPLPGEHFAVDGVSTTFVPVRVDAGVHRLTIDAAASGWIPPA